MASARALIETRVALAIPDPIPRVAHGVLRMFPGAFTPMLVAVPTRREIALDFLPVAEAMLMRGFKTVSIRAGIEREITIGGRVGPGLEVLPPVGLVELPMEITIGWTKP